MPKVVDYPRASLVQALELASAVEQLGGDCTAAAAAGVTGHRLGGTFTALSAAATKYGWVTARRSRLRTTPAFRDYRLAGDDATRRGALRTALLCPPLFARLARRFAGRPVPEGALPGLLVREFGVPEAIAARVAGYFVAGARQAGMLDGAILRSDDAGVDAPAVPAVAGPAPARDDEASTGSARRIGDRAVRVRRDAPRAALAGAAWDAVPDAAPDPRTAAAARDFATPEPVDRAAEARDYRLRFSRPGMDLVLTLRDAADVALARALLDRAEAALAGVPRAPSVDE